MRYAFTALCGALKATRPAPQSDGFAVTPATALHHSVARALAAAVADGNRLSFARSFTLAAASAYAASVGLLLPADDSPSEPKKRKAKRP